MKKWMLGLIVGVMVLGIATSFFTVANAYAKGTPSEGFAGFGTRVKQAFERGFRLGVKYDINQDIANFLGITLDQLRSEVSSGKTLAAIATEHGKTEQELINFIVAKEKAILDDALKTGKITQDRYNTMIANLETRVKERVETATQSEARSRAKKAFERGFRLGVKYDINQDIANFLGITLDQLRSEVSSGKTLAAIATEHGKTEQELINFIVAKEKAILDDALKTGKITQDRYNTMIANLETRVKERVETATQSEARSRAKKAFEKGFRLGVKYDINQDIANFLGITLDQLRSEVSSGKTLAAIATEHGKTEQELINFIVAKEKAILDDALKTGKITQDRYNTMIANLETRVKERVETAPHVGRP